MVAASMEVRKKMLNKHNFAIAALATDEQSMYVLDTLRVTPTETVVTDGRRMALVTTLNGSEAPVEPFEPFIIPAKRARDMAGLLAECLSPATLRSENGSAVFQVEDGAVEHTVKVRKSEGKYPDVAKVIPEKDAAEADITVNLQLLVPLLQQMLDFNEGWRGMSAVRIRLYGTDKPMRLDTLNGQTGQSMTTLLMCVATNEAL